MTFDQMVQFSSPLDVGGTVLEVNQVAPGMVGLQPSEVEGPEHLQIRAPSLRMLLKAWSALALRERASDTTQQSARANDSGRVRIDWRGMQAPGRSMLCSSKAGEPSTFMRQTRPGGSRLIDRGLAQDLGVKTKLHFDPGGVVCAIRAPVSRPPARPVFQAPHLSFTQTGGTQ